MTWAWNWLAVPFFAAAVLDIALAWLIYRARPRRFQNRVLAVLLFVTGVGDGLGSGLRLLTRDPAMSFGFWGIMLVALGILFPAYLLFCSTLPTPLAAPLRPTWVRVSICAVMGIAQVAILLLVPPVATLQWADPPGVYFVADDGTPVAAPLFATVVAAYGIATAFSAYRRAPPGSEKLGLRLVAVSLTAFWGFFALNGFVLFVLPLSDEAGAAFQFIVGGLATLASGTVLGYAILRTQIFDVDVRIRWTISRGTLIAIFLGVFFVVAQIAQAYLQQTQGYIVAGVATGTLLLAIRPLERLADRVASAALPGASRLSADERSRVYLEAAREAWADGSMSADERAMLDRMRAALGLAAEEALRLEAEASRRAEAAPSSSR